MTSSDLLQSSITAVVDSVCSSLVNQFICSASALTVNCNCVTSNGAGVAAICNVQIDEVDGVGCTIGGAVWQSVLAILPTMSRDNLSCACELFCRDVDDFVVFEEGPESWLSMPSKTPAKCNVLDRTVYILFGVENNLI